jgi:hypothetical protein
MCADFLGVSEENNENLSGLSAFWSRFEPGPQKYEAVLPAAPLTLKALWCKLNTCTLK